MVNMKVVMRDSNRLFVNRGNKRVVYSHLGNTKKKLDIVPITASNYFAAFELIKTSTRVFFGTYEPKQIDIKLPSSRKHTYYNVNMDIDIEHTRPYFISCQRLEYLKGFGGLKRPLINVYIPSPNSDNLLEEFYSELINPFYFYIEGSRRKYDKYHITLIHMFGANYSSWEPDEDIKSALDSMITYDLKDLDLFDKQF